ncbi:MAG: hypothetical protein H6601_02465 [Flavobacteriales bacterium]|nr:hypothetical protein [Flavobacteriales bacterium]
MELLIAVLIAFGVVSSQDASKISKEKAEKLIMDNNISQSDIDKEASIIGLEETDF